MKTKRIVDVREDDVVGEAIYKGNSLLLSAGTVLNSMVIQKLKEMGIKELLISHSIHDENYREKTFETFKKSFKQMNKTSTVPEPKNNRHMSNSFFQTIKNLIHENRYGLAINNSELLNMVVNEFEALMKIPEVFKYLYEIKFWDENTFYHVVDTFILGTLFSHYLSFSNTKQFSKGCLLHDTGKLYIPRAIIEKHGQLTLEEFELIKYHTLLGAEQLAKGEETEDIAYYAMQHHERLNGTGYPKGLQANELGQDIRALMIIDVYSAMTLKRSYRQALSSEEALSFLFNSADEFDQYYVKEFMSMLHIFPNDSVVTLSNNAKAKIMEVPIGFPYLPVLQNLNTGEYFQIPIDLSLSIKHIGLQPEIKSTKSR